MSLPSDMYITTSSPNKIAGYPVEASDVAWLFCSMSSSEMATFFNVVAKEVDQWEHGLGSFCMQMQAVQDDVALTNDAKHIMSIIGEYS